MGEKFDQVPEELKPRVTALAEMLELDALGHGTGASAQKPWEVRVEERQEMIAGDMERYTPMLESVGKLEQDYEDIRTGKAELHPKSRAWRHPDILEDLGVSPGSGPVRGGNGKARKARGR